MSSKTIVDTSDDDDDDSLKRDSGIVGKRNDNNNDQGKAQFVILREETKQFTGVDKNRIRGQGTSGAVVAKLTSKAHGGAMGGGK
jgi:hypothetical protein